MAENLKNKTFWGIYWCYINKFGVQILSLAPAMILTRLLSQSDYGLVAMAGVFTGIAYQLSDGGFGNALVQKKNADDLDYCSVFYFNLSICSFVYLLFFFLAPLFAEFFHQPQLTAIIRVSTLGLIFLAFGQVQGIIFKKNLEYKKPTYRNLVAQIISVVTGVTLALLGYGVWSLVYQGLAYTITSSLFNWVISTWKPTLQFSFQRLRSLFNYGSKLLLTSFIDYGFNNAYNIIIGRFYSPAKLADYNRGQQTVGLFSSTFFGVFSKVTFPLFVQMQDDDVRLRYNMRRFMIVSSMVIFYVMSLLFVLAEPLFHTLYSSKWDSALPFFLVLCVVKLFHPMVAIMESVLLAKGESGKFLNLSIYRKVFIVLSLLITYRFGVFYMVVGQIFLSMIDIILLSFYTKKLINYTLIDLVKDLTPYLLLSMVMGLLIYVANLFITWGIGFWGLNEFISSALVLSVNGILAVFVFFMTHKFLNLEGYKELVSFLRESIGNHKILKFLS